MIAAFLRYTPLVKIHIGPLAISPHGIGIAVGFVLGARLMLPAAARRGISRDDVYSLLTRAGVGAVIGARVAYVLNHPADYAADPLAALRVWEGGISLLGGIVGAVLAALPRMRALRLDPWQVMDAAAPGLALGIAIGRVGDLVVGDHLGKATTFALGYACPGEAASPCEGGAAGAVHLPALYDLVSVTVLLLLLLWLRRRPRRDGFLILVFGVGYGLARFVEDFFRIDDTHGTGLTGSQWSSLAAVVIMGVLLAIGRRRNGPRQVVAVTSPNDADVT